MIINLNKFTSIKNFKLDFTNLIPGIYFLISINKDTQRWKRIKNQYVPDNNGHYIIDHGFDLYNTVPRVLKYIGESVCPPKRLIEHYTYSPGNNNRKRGIGPKFTHIRIIKNFKRLFYDTVRLHHETLLVRKYLPELNSASHFTDNEMILLKNSAGLLKPNDLLKPYALHARDVYRAFKAWEIEDENYLNKELIRPSLKNKAGLIHPNRRDTTLYKDKNGKKFKFGDWFYCAVIQFHKKQKDAITNWRSRVRKYVKLFDPKRYEQIIEKDRKISKMTNIRNKEYIKQKNAIYYQLRKNKNQQKLL